MRHWTATERARQAELIRNWKPWEQSTSATTLNGKERSSQNSRKHECIRVKHLHYSDCFLSQRLQV